MFNSRAIAWSVWMTASIFYAYQYILRVMPNIMLVDIMNQFHIDATVFGQFSGIYYIGYSLMHLPIGIMLDRYGPKKVMSGCILLTVTGLLPIIFSEHWVYPLIGRLLIGIGSSAAILGTFKVIRMAFNEQHFTRMLSFSVTIGLIGAIYGGGPVSYMCKSLGYKAVVEIFAIIGLILAGITYLIVPNIESSHRGTVVSDIKYVLMNKKVIFVCCLAGFMVGPLEGFADVWGGEFLKKVYGYDAHLASYLPSMIFIGMCFGGPILSLIAEKSGRHIAVVTGAGIVMFITFASLVAHKLTITTMSLSFICVGICCAYQILVIYKVSTFVPEHVAGLTTAVANMVIMIFGYAFHTIIGSVINAYGGTEVAAAFVYGIGVIPVTLAVGVIGFLLVLRLEKNVSTK